MRANRLRATVAFVAFIAVIHIWSAVHQTTDTDADVSSMWMTYPIMPSVAPEPALLQSTQVSIPVYSLNPPPQSNTSDANSIIIGIACGIRHVLGEELSTQPLLTVLLPSLGQSLDAKYTYRLYFTYDTDDHIWTGKLARDAADERVAETARSENVNISVHWVECTTCSGKPAVAHSQAVIAAYLEGCQYVFRVNDDTEMPKHREWTNIFIADLAARPIPNLGVVGPEFVMTSATPILSHDFTHWTHVAIHGFHYPPSLPNWFVPQQIPNPYRYNCLLSKLAGPLMTGLRTFMTNLTCRIN
jgi:hypothetical protein